MPKRVQKEHKHRRREVDEAVDEPKGVDTTELLDEFDKLIEEIDAVLDEAEAKNKPCEDTGDALCATHKQAWVYSCSGEHEYCYGAV